MSVTPLLPLVTDGVRATFLRRPRHLGGPGSVGPFVVLLVVYAAVVAAIALVDTSPPWRLDPAGFTTVLSDGALTLVAAWILAAAAGRRNIALDVASVLLASTIVVAAAVHWPLGHLAVRLAASGRPLASAFVFAISQLWWLLVLLALSMRLAPRRSAPGLAAGVLAFAISGAAWWWLPAAPLLGAAGLPAPRAAVDDAATASMSTDPEAASEAPADEAPDPGFDAEAVMYEQPRLLDEALASITPQVPGKTDLYVVAFAGDGEEDVFRNEAEYAARLFAERFDAAGHVVVLENNPATVATRPLATLTNLEHALSAIAAKMDPAEDILLVYFTSHGSSDHELLVDLDPLPLNQLAPEDVGDALETVPRLRWKVLIVNACYSGGFVDALRDESTLVITSAREDRTSFGCGADSDITYFGKAFLVDGLNRTTSIPAAFDMARASVAAWEKADAIDASEPQIAISPSIDAKLARWQRQLPAHAAVPFTPAPKPAPDAD